MMIRHMRRTGSGRGERGDSALGVVVSIPAFLMFLGLVIMGGRLAIAQQSVLTAANEAARVASIARSTTAGAADAEQAARDVLSSGRLECTAVRVSVDSSRANPPLGTAGSVSVTVTCDVPLMGLGLPVDPIRTVTRTGTSVTDAYRTRG